MRGIGAFEAIRAGDRTEFARFGFLGGKLHYFGTHKTHNADAGYAHIISSTLLIMRYTKPRDSINDLNSN